MGSGIAGSLGCGPAIEFVPTELSISAVNFLSLDDGAPDDEAIDGGTIEDS